MTKRNAALAGLGLVSVAFICISLRNHPALGITPLAIAVIECLVYVCILSTVRIDMLPCAWGIALGAPLYLWILHFLDGYMIPGYIATSAVMIVGMSFLLKRDWHWCIGVMFLFALSGGVAFLSNAVAQWIVKREGIVRAFSISWNMSLYSLISMGTAELLCIPWRHVARNT